ncbi:Xaa-Pro aminopeptidase [Serratia symbiotica]|nr:Xaa-Pro aminopeptidase [Serratia symbiotica]
MIQNEFSARRHALFAKMAPVSAAVIFSAPEMTCSTDSYYLYRQNRDFWYLTGFNEPEAVLVLLKRHEKDKYSVLFNRVCDLQSEIWSGRRLGQDAAPATLGVDCAVPFDDINEQLHLLLNGLDLVYHAQGEYDYSDRILYGALDKLRKGNRHSFQVPLTQTDWRPWVHDMRLFKTSEELAIIRKAGEINTLAHTRAMEKCRPGMFEYELQAEIQHEFLRLGARHPSYNTIVGSGKNSCILHYTENSSVMQDGDLVLIDAGCEYQGYSSDITRTFPVNGVFTQPQRLVYDILLAAHLRALELFKPGISICEVNEQVVRIMISGLVEIGVMKGEVEQLFFEKAHRQFYMHGLSHWLGLDVHDVGSYGTSSSEKVLEPGMLLTVEPGLYIAPNEGVPEEYRGIGIRIEDDILITENGNENMTAGLVKDAAAIEELMAAARYSR